VPTREQFLKSSCAKLQIAQPNYDNVVENSTWTVQESSEFLKRRISQIFWSTLWTSSSLTADGRPLRSLSWTFFLLPIFDHSTPLSYSSFTHYILTVNRA
jgi:hypothetical protein